MRVLNGSKNVHLRWNYNLLDGQSIRVTVFRIYYGVKQPNIIGDVLFNEDVEIYDRNNYRDRFSINSTDEFATLTIKTVTERENTTFQCEILSEGKWAYNIRLEVTGINRFSWLLLIN